MANDQRFDSRYTGEEMENAFSVALAIANHSGIPKGTGKGNIQIISLDTDSLTSDGERIPTSAAVAQAIASARKVSELLTFKGIVQTTDDLPADAKPGFVYIVVQEDNENYAWDGVRWTPIGKLIAPIVLSSQSVSYQISDSGDSVPTGEWVTDCPEVQHGKYLWTRTVVQFSVGDPITSYSCAYAGVDGREITVSGVSPDATGNVTLTAADVGALAVSGGDMEGAINMNGQPISGLNDPTEDTQAARKGYVDAAATAANAYTDTAKAEANAYTDASVRKATPRNILDNSDFRNPVNQRGRTSYVTEGYCIDRWANMRDDVITLTDNGISFLSNKNVGGLYQFVEGKRLAGKTVTFAAKIKNNQYAGMLIGIRTSTWGQYVNKSIPVGDSLLAVTATIPSDETGNVPISIWVDDNSVAHSFDLEWAALYEGEYTAETLPEYQLKGYGAELAECRRYYMFYEEVACAEKGIEYPVLSLNFPPMRVIPTANYGELVAGDNTAISGAYVTYANINKTSVTTLSVVGTNGREVYKVRNLSLSADL